MLGLEGSLVGRDWCSRGREASRLAWLQRKDERCRGTRAGPEANRKWPARGLPATAPARLRCPLLPVGVFPPHPPTGFLGCFNLQGSDLRHRADRGLESSTAQQLALGLLEEPWELRRALSPTLPVLGMSYRGRDSLSAELHPTLNLGAARGTQDQAGQRRAGCCRGMGSRSRLGTGAQWERGSPALS